MRERIVNGHVRTQRHVEVAAAAPLRKHWIEWKVIGNDFVSKRFEELTKNRFATTTRHACDMNLER